MTREILFRGKRIDSGEWAEGYYVPIGEYHYILTGRLELVPYLGFEHFLVNPETVGRFSGLTDRNGTKIFEGDIIRWRDNTELSASGQIAEVCYGEYIDADSHFDDVYSLGFYIRFSDKNCVTISWLDEYKNYFDIIGNIYDSPELLEVNGNE